MVLENKPEAKKTLGALYFSFLLLLRRHGFQRNGSGAASDVETQNKQNSGDKNKAARQLPAGPLLKSLFSQT